MCTNIWDHVCDPKVTRPDTACEVSQRMCLLQRKSILNCKFNECLYTYPPPSRSPKFPRRNYFTIRHSSLAIIIPEGAVLFCFFSFFCGAAVQRGLRPPHSRFSITTQWRTTVGRTTLDELSARRRDLYLTTHNTQKRETSMPLAGFEPTTSAGEQPQTYALDRVAMGPAYCRI